MSPVRIVILAMVVVTMVMGGRFGDGALAAEPVKIGCVEFRPFTFTGDDGYAAGQAIALLTSLLDRAGLKWQSGACLPGARLAASLRDGTAHVAMLIRNPEVANWVHYGSMPMAFLQLDAYRAQGVPPLGSLAATKGKRIIVLRGYAYGGWIEFFRDPANAISVNYADSHDAAFRMLASGHGDYLVDYESPAGEALSKLKFTGFERESLQKLETYFLVSRKAPDAENLLRRIEAEFAATGARPVQ